MLWDGGVVRTCIWCGVVEGLPVYMVEPLPPHAFFWRGAFYGQVGDSLIYLHGPLHFLESVHVPATVHLDCFFEQLEFSPKFSGQVVLF